MLLKACREISTRRAKRVISLSSFIKKENIHYPIFKLQKYFHENDSFQKNVNFFLYKYRRWITLLIIKNRDSILKRAKHYYYENINTIGKNMKKKNIKIFLNKIKKK